jgi:hypothetical protein
VGGVIDCTNKADLRVLVPDYLASIPTAPSGGIYRVGINSNNKIAVYTIGESNQTIGINFATTNFGIIDVDALNYITAIEIADGQALEDNVKIAINNFIIGLKADGIWEPIKASVIMAGARTLNGALVPLKGTAPTNFNFVAGDYNRKTGLVGNGSTKYLDSNRNNNADPQDSKHLAIQVSQASTSGASTYPAYIGAGIASTGASGIGRLNNNGLLYYRANMSTVFNGGNGATTGFIGQNRNSSTNFVVRSQGLSSSFTGTSQMPFNGNIRVFNDGASINFANARLSFYSIGESLDLAMLDARVTQLMTDLGNAIP